MATAPRRSLNMAKLNAFVRQFVADLGTAVHAPDGCDWRKTRTANCRERPNDLRGTGHQNSWIPSLDGVKEKLEPGARVADVGCGKGASTRLMSEAFPKSQFFGFDYRNKSIEGAGRDLRKWDCAWALGW